MKKIKKHIPVLLEEAIDALNIKKQGIYIDATFGFGGHSKLILSKLGKNGQLISTDRDPESIKIGKKILDNRFLIKNITFSKLEEFIKKKN